MSGASVTMLRTDAPDVPEPNGSGYVGFRQDDAQQTILTRTQHLADRSVACAVVEHAGAAANGRLPVERVRAAQSRRDVVVVREDVLPVVPDARRDREPVADADLILDERAEHFLEEHERAVPLLLRERQRPSGCIVGERRERERAVAVGAIIEPAPAEVRHLDACLERVLPVDVGDRLGEIEVILRRALIRLRSAGRERVENDDAAARMQADASRWSRVRQAGGTR